MKSFVMIDKDEYDSQVHVPKREYEELVRKSSEHAKPLAERAMFFYDMLIDKLQNRESITGYSVAEWLKSRRIQFIEDCERQFGK